MQEIIDQHQQMANNTPTEELYNDEQDDDEGQEEGDSE